MNILFLHPNFPGQFRDSCEEIARHKCHDVRFLCQTHYGREIKGIKKLVIKGGGSHQFINSNSKNELEVMSRRAYAYSKAFVQLKNMGWNPDVVISHNGWGCGIHVKEIWPHTQMISYMEWWFNPNSDFIKRMIENKYIKMSEASVSKLWKRNMYPAVEMANSEKIITPTKWQKKQLPHLFRTHCQISPEKVDLRIFYKDLNQKSKIPLLTYGTRGMEPMRGFPEFIEILPELLEKWPTLNVEIAGVDEINYAGKSPEEGSWGVWAKKILKNSDQKRIHWIGRLKIEKYADWLRSSWCHVYLTEPFVTSWSFTEALKCCGSIVATDHEAIREFITDEDEVILANHYIKENLFAAINEGIRRSSRQEYKRTTITGSASTVSHLTKAILQMGKRPHSIDHPSQAR